MAPLPCVPLCCLGRSEGLQGRLGWCWVKRRKSLNRYTKEGSTAFPPVPPTPIECLGGTLLSVFALKQRHRARPWGQLDTATDEVAVRDRLLGSNSQEGDSWRRTRSSSWDWYLNREPDLKGGGMGIAPTANPLLRQESQDLFGPASFPPVLPKLNFLCPPQLIF